MLRPFAVTRLKKSAVCWNICVYSATYDKINIMSDKASIAENQQATKIRYRKSDIRSLESSETTSRSPNTKKEIIAYLNGALHDASLNKGKRIRFSQKNQQWLKKLKLLLRKIDCNSWIYREGKNRNLYVLETLCRHLDFGFNPDKLKSKTEKKFYIQGFFDAEGGIPHTNDRFYIQLVQKNHRKMEQIKRLLKNLGIDCGEIHNPSKKVDPNYWRIFVFTKHHRKFAQIINSLHPVKIKIFRKRMKI